MRKWIQGRRRYSDKIFYASNTCILFLLLIVFFWPLWFVVIASFSDSGAVTLGKVILWPVEFTLKGYDEMIQYKSFWVGYANSIYYSVLGTIINIIMTICCAYPLSNKQQFLPRKFVLYFCMITMYVSGGVIPSYLVVKGLGLVDTRWAMMIPCALSFYNALIVRAYFMDGIPGELQEASILDGANAFQHLIRVTLPLSKPVLAVVSLYYFVGHWNDFYSALIYIYDADLVPLQSVLKNLLVDASSVAGMVNVEDMLERLNRMEIMKYSTVIVSMLPVLIIYPFIQKYFVKGVMIGAVKG